MRIPSPEVLLSRPKPNYVDPETRGPVGRVLGITLISLVTIVVVLRVYTRHFISKGFGLDDVLILLAYVPAVAFAVIGVVGEVYFQWDRHIWDVLPKLFVPSLKASLAEQIIFDLATSLTKLSMLAMLYRLAKASTDGRMRIGVLLLAVWVSLGCFVFILVTIFQCSPVSDYWTLSLGPQNCINEGAHLLAAGVINTTTDFILVVLPIKTVLALELPRKQQIIVLGLFGTGFIICVAASVRTYYTWVMFNSGDHDTTWNAWVVNIAGQFELFIGIICASLPAIKPFFANYLPNIIGASIRSYTRTARDAKSVQVRKSQISVQSRSSATYLLQKPERAVKHQRLGSADLNKPLPSIRYTEQAGRPSALSQYSEDRSLYSQDFTPDSSAQRGGVRYSDRSAMTRSSGAKTLGERQTVFIMLERDEDIGRGI